MNIFRPYTNEELSQDFSKATHIRENKVKLTPIVIWFSDLMKGVKIKLLGIHSEKEETYEVTADAIWSQFTDIIRSWWFV